MNFSPSKYSQLKSRLKQKYRLQLNLTAKEMKSLPNSKISVWVDDNLDELKNFSSLNWHFLSMLKLFNFFNKQDISLGKTEFGAREEILFDKWNNSEFAREFLENLNLGQPIGKASRNALKVFDRHLVVFGERHILKKDKLHSAYRVQTSLGEYIKRGKVLRLLETTLHLDKKDLRLMTSSIQEMKEFSNRIEIALKVIKKFSPSSWKRFAAFTEVIIPIKQKEIVSYSHQDLPGYSMINLYHRDFVDLMDDLLHENGHHHLNYYLNLGKLIDEPQDQIYYSPWRRTPRPLRGIYHAYFTFFWAFKLFADLARSEDIDSIYYLFNNAEKEKVLWRAIEEFHMLNFTFLELKWARKQGLIRNNGWQLIQEQQKELMKFQKKIPVWEKKLKTHKTELKELKTTLKVASRTYLKN